MCCPAPLPLAHFYSAQMMDFRDGIRTNSPGGIMRKITMRLTDEEIEALADYISVL